jgi:transcriptional regulator with XRE-family HTH domain
MTAQPSGTFAARLRELLAERGVSYRALASRVYQSKSALHDYAGGKRIPAKNVIVRIDSALAAGGELVALAAESFRPGASHEAAGEEERLRYVLSQPSRMDLTTVAYLREQIASLDARYDRVPSATLLAGAGQRHGQIAFLAAQAGAGRLQRDLRVAVAASATLVGQLIWDASMRRDHGAAMKYFGEAFKAAEQCGDRLAAARAQLRSGYVALYGLKAPHAGQELAGNAARLSDGVSDRLAGLALLHVAEGYAMRLDRRECEAALGAAEQLLARSDDGDEAAELVAPTDLARMAGSCYLFLGEAPRAVGYLCDTLDRVGERTKATAVTAANLSMAYSATGRVDDAVASLHHAVDIIDATRGGGGLTVAFAAARRLNPWRSEPAVDQVHERLLSLVAA